MSHEAGYTPGAERSADDVRFQRDQGLAAAAKALAKGDQAAASRLYAAIAREYPTDPEVLTPSAQFLCSIGRGDIAIRKFREALASAGKTAALLTAYAALLMRLGKFREAAQAAEAAVQEAPSHAAAWAELGRACAMLQRNGPARTAFERALQFDPGMPAARLGLARCAAAAGDRRAAVAHFRDALIVDARNTSALCELARNLAALGDIDEAGRVVMRAQQIAPQDPAVVVASAEYLVLVGRAAEAGEMLAPLVRERRLPPDAARLLPDLAAHVGGPDVARGEIERLLAEPACPPAARASLEAWRGALFEQAGGYEQAFASYTAAHAGEAGDYDPVRTQRTFERLATVFSREALARMPRAASRERRVIFVLGMPRSGTTLVEQVLASHSEISGAGELPLLPDLARELPSLVSRMEPYPQCIEALTAESAEACARRLLEQYSRRAGDKRLVTDKYPHNFLHLGLIELLLPGARVVHCVRDAVDNCLSLFATPLSAAHAYRRRLDWLGAYYRAYQGLMRHWSDVLTLPMLTVSYEAFVADPPTQTRRLLEFLELPWEDACLRFHESQRVAVTASRDQVRRAVYDSSVARAARFGSLLDPLRAALADNAAGATPPAAAAPGTPGGRNP